MICNLSNYLAYSLIIIGSVLWSSSALPNQIIKNELTQFGIIIASISAKKGETFDISVIDSESGNTKIKNAIELIFRKSPFNTKIIRRLSKFGKILVIYDPSFPIATKPKIEKVGLELNVSGNFRNGKIYFVFIEIYIFGHR